MKHSCPWRRKGLPAGRSQGRDLLRLEDGFVMEILNPPDENPVFTSSPDNNHSLAIRLIYGTTEFLFARDLEEEALEYLVDKDLVRQVTVFKFPSWEQDRFLCSISGFASAGSGGSFRWPQQFWSPGARGHQLLGGNQYLSIGTDRTEQLRFFFRWRKNKGGKIS